MAVAVKPNRRAASCYCKIEFKLDVWRHNLRITQAAEFIGSRPCETTYRPFLRELAGFYALDRPRTQQIADTLLQALVRHEGISQGLLLILYAQR
jgi:hypothetical protein